MGCGGKGGRHVRASPDLQALRLDYYSLKERVEQQSIVAPDPPKRTTADQRFASVPAFLELAPVTNRGFAAAPSTVANAGWNLRTPAGQRCVST